MRVLAPLLSLSLAGLAVSFYLDNQHQKEGLLGALAATTSGDVAPDLARRIAREPDPTQARLLFARELLRRQSQPGRLTDLVRTEQIEALRQTRSDLDQARTIAGEALRQRPASWLALLILGVSRVLQASPDELGDDIEAWERPLLLARSRNPTEPEAARYLAFGYLELWPQLSKDMQRSAKAILEEAFTDRGTLDQLLDTWLDRAASREEAFSVLPETSGAWQRVQEISAADADWPSYLSARRRWRQAQALELRRRLAEATVRLQGGDLAPARDQFRTLAARLPVHGENLPHLQEILRLAPAGALNQSSLASLGRWLDWTLELCFLSECPLDADRLARLAQNSGELAPAVRALATLLAGDLAGAEAIERRESPTLSASWGRFHILRAVALLDRDDPGTAAEALLHVAPLWQDSPRYWQTKLRLAERRQDLESIERSRQILSSYRSSDWLPSEWQRDRRVWRLGVFPTAAGSLRLEWAQAADRGAIAEVHWDGQFLGDFLAETGGALALPVADATHAHTLEVRLVTGSFTPGRTSLTEAPSTP